MREPQGVVRILAGHFFRRFFDNDTLQAEGDTLTTVVRAISVVAVPGLMAAFFLQSQYIPHRPAWGAIQDQYFYVLFSFVVMGAVANFEWEMLFPDRLDFLVLSPLSIKPAQMLATKALALAGFFALFLAACNLFGVVMLPAVSHMAFWRQVLAHGTAAGLAGLFAALFFLALGGVLLCIFGAAGFRVLSPLVQMFSVMALVLMLLHYLRFGNSLEALLSGQMGWVRWLPPVWFLGVYERVFHGDEAPAFALEMSRFAMRATGIALATVLVTYPMAWSRMQHMAIEGASRRQRQPWEWVTRMLHRAVPRPGERGAFHFIGQTMVRNNRYHAYLAMYCGTGLALAVSCAVASAGPSDGGRLALSEEGLHAVMPLLLFWLIAGLRTAFAFPLNLAARWVFRVTGVDTGECASAGRRWVLFCALVAMCCVVGALAIAGWEWRYLLVQVVCGGCLCMLLTDGFFAFQQGVPFNTPRMPGKTSLPLMLTLYVGVLPMFIVGMIRLETQLEKHPIKLTLLVIGTALLHAGLLKLNQGPAEIEEEMEGYDGEFQLLGLS